VVGFTTLASAMQTKQLVLLLNHLFTKFDTLVDQQDVYKVETIGDAYMAASGHDSKADHAMRLLQMAIGMLKEVRTIKYSKEEAAVMNSSHLQIRLGLHTGPTYAGVVGKKCPRYCFFGDTVNTASRMESTGVPMCIQMSEAFFNRIDWAAIQPEWRGAWRKYDEVAIKGKGLMTTYIATPFQGGDLPTPSHHCPEVLAPVLVPRSSSNPATAHEQETAKAKRASILSQSEVRLLSSGGPLQAFAAPRTTVELLEFFTRSFGRHEFVGVFRPLWDTMHLTTGWSDALPRSWLDGLFAELCFPAVEVERIVNCVTEAISYSTGTSELKSIADETLTARTQMKMLSATVEDMRGWMGQMMDDTVSKVDHNMNAVVHEMQDKMETIEKGLSSELTKELQTACIPIPTPTGRQRGSGVEGQSGREREVGWCGPTRSAAIPTPKPTPTSAFSSAARAARTSTPTSSSIRAPAASPPSSAFRMLRARTLPATFDLNSPEAMVPFVKAAGLEQYEYGRLLSDEEVTIGLLASIGSRELEELGVPVEEHREELLFSAKEMVRFQQALGES